MKYLNSFFSVMLVMVLLVVVNMLNVSNGTFTSEPINNQANTHLNQGHEVESSNNDAVSLPNSQTEVVENLQTNEVENASSSNVGYLRNNVQGSRKNNQKENPSKPTNTGGDSPKIDHSNSGTTSNDGWKHRALMLTSAFENLETFANNGYHVNRLVYEYAENFQDGRGITFGFFGACTGTGDGYKLVTLYTQKNPNNPLAKFLPQLKQINDYVQANSLWDGTDKMFGINEAEFISATKEAAKDPLFIKAQHEIADELYWNPSQGEANQIGLKMPISKAIMYDSTIQHGFHGTQAIIRSTTQAVGKTPTNPEEEIQWITKFIELRSNKHQYYATQRGNVYKTLIDQGNVDLTGDIVITVYGTSNVKIG
jgi:chitosanase